MKKKISIICPNCGAKYNRTHVTQYNFLKGKGLFMCKCGKCCIRNINLLIDLCN